LNHFCNCSFDRFFDRILLAATSKSPTTGIAGGLKDVNRSKRLKTMGHLKGGRLLPEQVHLIDSSIFSFLLFDVFADRFLVSAYRRNMVPSCPNWNPCYMIFAFPLRIA
jgi:hypothetical protein